MWGCGFIFSGPLLRRGGSKAPCTWLLLSDLCNNGVGSACGSVPEKRVASKRMECGTWHTSIHILQLAEEGVPSCGISERYAFRVTSKASRNGNSIVCPMWSATGGHPCRGRHRNDLGNSSLPKVMLSDFKCSCPVYLTCGTNLQ